MSGLPYKECTNASGGCFTAKACLFDCRLEKRDEKMSEAFERVSRERDEHARWRQDLADKLDEVERHRDALAVALNKRENDLMAAHNALAQMMLRRSLATGHGDTVQDMVRELEWQIVELQEAGAAANTIASERDEAISELPQAVRHERARLEGPFRLLIAACNRLSEEAEEYNFDDGMGRGALQGYWDEFEDALEKARDVIGEAE